MTDKANALGLRINVMRAGLLLGLHVRIDGGRSYETTPVEVLQDDGTMKVTRWQTTRTIQDEAEWKAASECATACGGTVRKSATQTDFGPLVPVERIDDLWTAIAEARATARAFNDGAKFSRVRVTMMPAVVGDLAPEVAARVRAEAEYAVAGEIRSLLEDMENGIKSADVKGIRDAADKARLLGAMLDETQAAKVGEAIQAARKVARDIVRRVEKSGELASTVLADLNRETAAVQAARFTYLDLETSLAPEGEALPAVQVQRFADIEATTPAAVAPAPVAARTIEFEDEAPAAPAAPAVAARDLDLDAPVKAAPFVYIEADAAPAPDADETEWL